MREVVPGIEIIDTRLAGHDGYTAAYLVRGARPAIVDTGSHTSTDTVVAGLAAAGLAPDDLSWIVLTHIHLDHCGATGGVAAAFPNATVVVHRRGARHLAEPDRLVAAPAAVHGRRLSQYGGHDTTPAERILAVEDGHRVEIGPGHHLLMAETLGHARHHMSVLDEATGVLMAGDVVGVRFETGGQYPAMPPADIDFAAWNAALDRVAGLMPTVICPTHFGPTPDPGATIATTREQLALAAQAAREGWATGDGVAAVAAGLDRLLPLEPALHDEDALRRWRFVGWHEANPDGVALWAKAQEDAAGG